jgi:WRKY transcription factor 33
MASSAGSLDHAAFTFTPPNFITSFTDLLSGSGPSDGERRSPRGFSQGSRGGVPKFKSAQPPSLPISPPPPGSPFSYFSIPAGLSPAELLDSPVLLNYSNVRIPSSLLFFFDKYALTVSSSSTDLSCSLYLSYQILASPTTGAIPAQKYDWKDLIASQQEELSRGDNSFADFSFHAVNSNAAATSQTNSFPSFKVHTNTHTHIILVI